MEVISYYELVAPFGYIDVIWQGVHVDVHLWGIDKAKLGIVRLREDEWEQYHVTLRGRECYQVWNDLDGRSNYTNFCVPVSRVLLSDTGLVMGIDHIEGLINDPQERLLGTVSVTVSGLKIKSDWEERTKKLCGVDSFTAQISMTDWLMGLLTKEERDRTRIKLGKVEDLSKRLAVGMLKGSLKYTTDAHSDDEWDREIRDEMADFINYWLLKG